MKTATARRADTRRERHQWSAMCHAENCGYVGWRPHSMCGITAHDPCTDCYTLLRWFESPPGHHGTPLPRVRTGQASHIHPQTKNRPKAVFCFHRAPVIFPGTLLLVPKRGLEPLRLTSLPPQGSASTSSATWAGVLLSAWPAASQLPAPRPDLGSGRGLPPALRPVRRCWLRLGRPLALPNRPARQVRSYRLPACRQVQP